MKRILPIAFLITTAIMAAAPAANAASYMKLSDVKGTASADPHHGAIEIASWSLGASNPTSAGSSGMSAGKVSYSDLSVMISLEKAPLGLKAGSKIPVVEIRGGDQQDYYTVTLEDVLVSSYAPTAGGGARLSLNYTKIEFKYTPIDDKDRVGTGKTMAAEVIA